MTAEIAIMNKQAIALAADSAVTFSTEKRQKIFTSAHKIFSLSNNHPIGIMVYGNASLLQVPWETIIKLYDKNLGEKKFDTLQEYCNDFLKFIRDNRILFPKEEQKRYIIGNINGYFEFLKKKIIDEIGERLEKKENISKKDVEKIAAQVIEKEYKIWQKSKFIDKATKKKVSSFKTKYSKLIQQIRKKVFEKLPLDQPSLKKINEIAVLLFFKFHEEGVGNTNTSGLVIAGFGEREIFPCLSSYTIEGIADGFLKFRKDNDSKIDFKMGAAILPFAQREMVVRFVEGIDPSFLRVIAEGLYELATKYPEIIFKKVKISDKIKEKLARDMLNETKSVTTEFLQKFKQIRQEYFVDPILQVVGILPKDELAIMAETLVTLTSFKRRVSMEDETVGGPVDVAVISKGDGFVWIKKKEYFDKNLQ